jgi:hypothetical protein
MEKINIGAKPNDKTGTPARIAGAIINANFENHETRIIDLETATPNIPFFNKITKPNGFSLLSQTLTINAGWEWLLANIPYTNASNVVFPNIPLCSAGKKRFVYFVPNNANTFEMKSGAEGVIPVAPPLPNEGVYATYLLITDSLINEPANPNPNNTPSLKQVTAVDGESFTPISVTEPSYEEGISIYKNILSFWRNGIINKYINILCNDIITTYNIRFPAKADGSNEVFAMVSDLEDYYTKPEIDSKISSVYKFKGNVANYASLPSTGLIIGDVYNLLDTGANYAWTGTLWDKLGDTVDISGKEDSSNKSQDIEADKASTSKYGSVKAFYDWVVGGFQRKLVAGANIVIDNTNPLAPIVSVNAEPAQITITTAVSITTETLDASGVSQKGKHVIIANGVNAINNVVNGVGEKPTSYQKEGTGAITFVQGSGRTLRLVSGTAILNGAAGSTATITSYGTIDSLLISNA